MPESVSGVDAIVKRLRRQVIGTHAGRDFVVLADAEAAVHATVREIEAWLRSDEAIGQLYGMPERRLTAEERKYGGWSLANVADEVARRFGGTA